ncbi:O-antigen ligase family protein [Hominibacterium faecale]|uniref:O-antigen ligase family protein n=1 Tax=Hominibacterium faecale TaxID=2839743 RepID=UPI0022B2997D|nr:O-antigen ligase family protein [Hominibacterium faecale]
MALLQPVYSIILNQIYKLTGKIPYQIRYGIMFIWLIALEILLIIGYSTDFLAIKVSLNERAIAGGITLIIFCIFSIKGPLKRVQWSLGFSSIWFIFALLMLLSGFDHAVGDGYRLSGWIILLGFPCLAFIWNNRGDYEVLYRLVSKAICVVSVAYFLFCLIIQPEQASLDRYTGTIDNPNTLGLMAVSGIISASYLFTSTKNYRWIFSISFGTSVTLGVYSVSRNAIITILLLLIVISIYMCRVFKYKGYSIRVSIKRYILGVLGFTVISLLCIIIFGMGMSSEKNIVSAASLEPTKEINLAHWKSAAEVTADSAVGPEKNPLKERFTTEGKDLNSFSAGRVEIWKAYIQQLNLKGNDIKGSEFPIGDTSSKYLAAHNVYLEISYRSGIIAGLLFLIFVLIAAIKALCCLFRRKEYKEYDLFIIMAIGAYGCTSLFESLVHPFSRSIVFLFYLAVIPFLAKPSAIKKDRDA